MNSPLTLRQTAGLIAGHHLIEAQLFRLTGAWSVGAEYGDGPDGGGEAGGAGSGGGAALDGVAVRSQALFAEISAHHGWRAEQWDQRQVRSVDGMASVEGESAVEGQAPVEATGAVDPGGTDADRLKAALAGFEAGEVGPTTRLAVWGHALAPWLAGRYQGHRASIAPAADGGLDRWLGICLDDLHLGMDKALGLLAQHRDTSGAALASEAVAACLEQLLGREPSG
ncbi:MAG: hypothetical protein ACR2OH_01365 [Microthrixaceae bacterium]